MRKVKSYQQNLRRKKASDVFLHSSSPSAAFDVEEVFPEDDTRGLGCVYSDVHVKEEDLDNSIVDNKEENSKVSSMIDSADELMENASLMSNMSSLAESLRGGNDEITGESYLTFDCLVCVL